MHLAALIACCIAGRAAGVQRARGAAARQPHDEVSLPEVPLSALLGRSPSAAAAARAAIQDLGGLVVTGVASGGAGLGDIAREALGAWAACLQEGGGGSSGVLSRPLAGGAVTRTSVTSRDGWSDTLAAWPARCPGAEDASSELRLSVRRTTRALVAALGGWSVPVLGDGNASLSEARVPLHDALDRAQHLEHLHLYQEAPGGASGQSSVQALDLHTDAGLLLAFVPPVSWAPGGADLQQAHLVDVELPGAHGPRRLAPLPRDSVCFLAGELAAALVAADAAAAPAAPWRPMPHGLALPEGFRWRAWYGTMLLLPERALLRTRTGRRTTFAQFWQAAREEVGRGGRGDVALVACGDSALLADQARACPEGTAECWMSCMSLAGLEGCSGQTWVATGVGGQVALANLSVQCVDPGTGKRWPEETGQMCSSCKLSCAANGPSFQAASQPGDDGAFCVRASGPFHGTTMYMDGFRWTSRAHDETCIAFLMPSLVVDSPWKLALACVCAVALAMSVELVSFARRCLLKSAFAARYPRWGIALAVAVQAVSLSLAYLVMLLVMTYSVELLLCTITGLVLGPTVTSWGSSGGASRMPAAGHGGTPCCRLAAGLDALEAGGGEGVRTTLIVAGMTCGACEDTVRRALQQAGGVVEAVSHADGTAVVLLAGPGADAAALLRAVEEVGFECRLPAAA